MARPSGPILCVDDDPGIQELLVWHLHNAGFHALAVSSGIDALKLSAAEPVSLFILDFQLPEMDGQELAEKLRRAHPGVPLVLISSSAVPPAALRIVDHFIAKDGELMRKLIPTVSELLRVSGPVH